MRIHALALSSLFGLISSTAMGGDLFPQQIIGEDNLVPIEDALGTPVYEWARAVAHVDLGSAGCTGFRLSEDLFMTNHHCYASGSCRQTTFTLGRERDMPRSGQKVFRCKEVLSYSRSLDYALYRVETDEGALDDFPSVVLAATVPPLETRLVVPGFPCCEQYKRVDLSDSCRLKSVGGDGWNPLVYTCDTISGSSGSPVMDKENGHVIGIHWGYSGSDGNNATQMYKVLDHIQENAPEAYGDLTIVD